VNFNYLRSVKWRPKRINPLGDEAQRVESKDILITDPFTVTQKLPKFQPCWQKGFSATCAWLWGKNRGIFSISVGVLHEPLKGLASGPPSGWTVPRGSLPEVLGGGLHPLLLGKEV